MLDTDLSLLRLRDKIPQTWILVSFSLGKRLNRQRVLGADLSLLRIRDKIPHACEARILELKDGVFSWGKDKPKIREEEFYILSPVTKGNSKWDLHFQNPGR